MRPDNRTVDALRPLTITPHINPYAEGSCLVAWGNTHIHCTASVEERVPPFLRGKGEGWVTAEYAMLPRATHGRSQREVTKGKPSGRTSEIQRLIGRSLRSVVDMKALGERQITLDCDVLRADGGTRTASITGAYVALGIACEKLLSDGLIEKNPLTGQVAAVSCGVIDGEARLDLMYEEDSNAQADVNFVLTKGGGIVEIQGTAEEDPFSEEEFMRMFALAKGGVKELFAKQDAAIALPFAQAA